MKKLNSCLLSAAMVAGSIGIIQADTTKIAGKDRFDTAAKIADELGAYSTAVLVNGYSTADGLSASSFAEYKNAPILLTKANSIPDVTMQRLSKVNKIYIIGGTAVVSSSIEKQLENMGKSVIRIHGKDRVSTSIEVANAIGRYDKAFIVNGFKGDADAMSVAPVAARDKAPIIVTNGKTIPYEKESGVDYYAIGGTAVISKDLANYYRATRIAGNNRYETNKKVLDKFYADSKKLYCSNGQTLVDALAVSTLASNDGVALVSENSDKSYLANKELVQVGGMKFDVYPYPDGDPEHPMPRPLNITVGKPSITVNQGDTVKVSDFEVSAKNYLGEKVSESDMSFESFPGTNKAGTYSVKIKIRDRACGCYEYKTVTMIVKPVTTEKTYDVYSMEFQNIVREEFYKYLDAYRKANGVPASEHRWEVEESTLLKSKYMIEKGEISHDVLEYPNFGGGAEAVASAGQIQTPYTEKTARDLGKSLFEQWKNSPPHKDILLSDCTKDMVNCYQVDGFSFWAGETGYGNHFIFAAFQSAPNLYIRK